MAPCKQQLAISRSPKAPHKKGRVLFLRHTDIQLLTKHHRRLKCKHHHLLVLLEVILFSQRCLHIFILVPEIPLPSRAEIDMPSPEPSYQRLRVLVIPCPERTCLTTILLCHNYILNKSIQAPHPAPSSGQTQASASASRQKSPFSGKTRTLPPLQFLPVVSSMLSESLSSRHKYTKKYFYSQRQRSIIFATAIMENLTSIGISVLVLAIIVIAVTWAIRGIDWKLIFKPKGERGEYYVSKLLNQLPEDQYRILNDITIPGKYKTSQIDHIVVSIYGIFVIETKYYKGWIFGTEDSEYWTQNIYGYKYRLYNPIRQNKSHILALKKALPELEGLPIFSIIAFSSQAQLDNRIPCSYVIYWGDILPAITSRKQISLTQEQVSYLSDKILSIRLDPELAKSRHISQVYITKFVKNSKIQSGICPRCGGKLVLRHGKYGSFYGCSNYPYCKFTLDT